MMPLEKLAIFLRDYGQFADRAILIIAVIYLFRGWRKEAHEKFELAMSLAPIVGRLTDMVERAAVKKARKSNPPPGVGEKP